VDSDFVYHWLYFSWLAPDTWLSKFFQDAGCFEQKIPGYFEWHRLGIFNYSLPLVRHDARECVFGMGEVMSNE